MNSTAQSATGNTPTFAEIVDARLNRRQVVAGIGLGAAVSAAGALGVPLTARTAIAGRTTPSTLNFTEAERAVDVTHRVAPGYTARVLIGWGDPVVADAPAFDPRALNADGQARQFGYNNDFVAYMPLPRGSQASDHGLLCVNNEYTDSQLMWPGISNFKAAAEIVDREQAGVEMQAHGHSVIEIRRNGKGWEVVPDSPHARRITATTPMRVSGPAAGDPRLRTSADPTATKAEGTINNCGGGKTPWGTVLICEENFHYYFGGDVGASGQAEHHGRYGIKGNDRFGWSRFHDRFDVGKEPNEPNRFGWIVEFDPYDPRSVPIKRTALGRFKHEGAATWIDPSGRVVVYSGDDEVFQFLYRFVTGPPYVPDDAAANRDLLDDGTLSVARFDADGQLSWLPLVFGQGPLTPDNGFKSQADVVVEARRAGELLGATPMDRPEDVEVNPATGRAYLMLTKNKGRTETGVDAANPRGPNPHGHIIELLPPGPDNGRDHLAGTFGWEILLLAGDPNADGHGAAYHPAISDAGWFVTPDNCAFDPDGRLWIATDQGGAHDKTGIPDGLYACDVDGEGRALTRFFFGGPRGAEMTGPEFTPDGRTLFVSVQHPAEEKGSTFDNPTTRWPDFDPDVPPRPSVVVITKDDGGRIGS